MLVETFEQLELGTASDGTVTPEDNVEALALCEELGLEGQKKLNVRTTDEGPITARFPYREMTATEAAVYGILCPTHSKVADYSAGPIPLRVLQVVAHAKGMFNEIHVWAAASPVVKDPVLVGIKVDPTASWRTTRYILARWGDVLESFDALLVKAAKIQREKFRTLAQRIQTEVGTCLAALKTEDDETIVRRSEPTAYHLVN